jgi:AcrR family transcriptional regulator
MSIDVRRVNSRLQAPPGLDVVDAVEAAASRPKGPAQTRARILSAAQQAFSRRGFGGVGLREIAADAGVNVALVARYFGGKEGLFSAALDELLTANNLWETPRETFGGALVSKFIDTPRELPNPLPMMMLSSADPVAKTLVLDLVRTHVLAPLAMWLGPPSAEARAAEIMALCSSFLAYRILLPLAPFAADVDPQARDWLARSLQALVDGPAPAAPSGGSQGPA